MNPKKLKKIVRRQTAKKRAKRQTARRQTRLETDKFKDQVAQDIYESLQVPKGDSRRKRTGDEYRLKEYSYDMFEYGDPLKVGGRALKAAPSGRRASSGKSLAKTDAKNKQKRKALWAQNIKMKKEKAKKAKRENRKKRKKANR
jgi:hypothetical protein